MEKQAKGLDLFNMALYAFAGLGMECIYAYLLEPAIYGTTFDFSTWSTWQVIVHWIVTCTTWGIWVAWLLSYAKKKYQIDLFAKNKKITWKRWMVTAFGIIFALTMSYIERGNLKCVAEFQTLGPLKFIFQYIYYFFETILFTLIIVFAQKAFEIWFKNKNIPYGGIILAFTWGLAHIFTKGSILMGAATAFFAFFYGFVYLLLNRNLKWTMVVLFVMFAV